jgi:hypothetical protein
MFVPGEKTGEHRKYGDDRHRDRGPRRGRPDRCGKGAAVHAVTIPWYKRSS